MISMNHYLSSLFTLVYCISHEKMQDDCEGSYTSSTTTPFSYASQCLEWNVILGEDNWNLWSGTTWFWMTSGGRKPFEESCLKKNPWYCGWNKSCTSRLNSWPVWNTGTGFQSIRTFPNPLVFPSRHGCTLISIIQSYGDLGDPPGPAAVICKISFIDVIPDIPFAPWKLVVKLKPNISINYDGEIPLCSSLLDIMNGFIPFFPYF